MGSKIDCGDLCPKDKTLPKCDGCPRRCPLSGRKVPYEATASLLPYPLDDLNIFRKIRGQRGSIKAEKLG
jgi:hypothetical protein